MSDNENSIDLAGAGFKRHQLAGYEKRVVLEAFAGYVIDVIGKINDGKEATVYLCQADSSAGVELLAAKMFRAKVFKAFDNDRQYRNLRKFKDRRMAKLMAGNSARGQRNFHYHWIDTEWRVLCQLYEEGVAVPKPYLHCADGILMEYFGERDRPAPRLIDVKLSDQEAGELFAKILDDVESMLNCSIVHGDLSAYNLLYREGDYRIIDLPQAVDIRTMPDGRALFERDLVNLCKYFKKQGVDPDPALLAQRMWY